MSRSLASRLAAQSLLRPSLSQSIRSSSAQAVRVFSQSTQRWADDKSKDPKPRSSTLLENLYGAPRAPPNQTQTASENANSMGPLSQSSIFKAMTASGVDTSALSGQPQAAKPKEELEPYHFHVYTHKHNTHVTCTRPNHEPIISMSCGNLGFRKTRRGTFDSAYSLIKYAIERLIHNGWPMKIQRLEVVLRGYGNGREAAMKVLMSPEGKVLRDKIVRVSDSTRLKFGGTRSPRPRRL